MDLFSRMKSKRGSDFRKIISPKSKSMKKLKRWTKMLTEKSPLKFSTLIVKKLANKLFKMNFNVCLAFFND